MKTKKSILLRSIQLIGLALVTVISLDSCKKTPTPPPTGPSTVFHNVWINGSCNVTFTSGPANTVISKDPLVSFIVMGNTLMLNGVGKATIAINDLDTLFSNGTSDIDGSAVALLKDVVVACNGTGTLSATINAKDSISVLINGSGTYTFKGTTPKLNLVSNSLGKFLGYNLTSQNCDIFMNGTADQQVYVSGILNVWMNGTGNVYYKGNPATINKFNNGTGSLIPQ